MVSFTLRASGPMVKQSDSVVEYLAMAPSIIFLLHNGSSSLARPAQLASGMDRLSPFWPDRPCSTIFHECNLIGGQGESLPPVEGCGDLCTPTYAVGVPWPWPSRSFFTIQDGCPRGYHRRDTIAALLWPDLDQQHAMASIA